MQLRVRFVALLTFVVTLTGATGLSAATGDPVLVNEVLASHTGTDDTEYIELYGTPGASLGGLSLIVVESDSGSSQGRIDRRLDFSAGDALGANGFFLVGNPAGLGADYSVTPNVSIANDFLENSSLTLALVETASLAGGVGTSVSGSEIVRDSVALNDGGTADVFFFSAPVIGPDGSFFPAGARRSADGVDTDAASDWTIADFNLGSSNTPTAGSTTSGGGEGGCGTTYTPIYDIQGSGSSAAITGNVTTEGIVVGDFEGSAGLRGFYLQDAAGDGDPGTSDGIFVFNGSDDTVGAGEHVRVSGSVGEFSGQTQISSVTRIAACGSGDVGPTDVLVPFATLDEPERYEGMLVRFPQSLVIAEYFNYDRFGEVVLAQPLAGESRPFTPTLLEEPGAEAQARLEDNLLRRITLDDGVDIQNPAFVRHPNGDFFSLANRFRGGDTVANTVGVLAFGRGLYRVQPTARADYTATNPRPGPPTDVGGSLTVAAFNMLNYFLTLDYPSSHPRDDTCGATRDMECRGADADQPDEFQRQRTKLLDALAGLDADVVGVNEIENTPGVDPLADIAAGLNDRLGAGTYGPIDTGVIGSDAIRVGLLYKPGEVKPVGDFSILDSSVEPRFDDDRSRPALAQTFEEIASGARFTVVVNHLKSKGSSCAEIGDPDTGDGQGNCNVTRTRAAEALVDWVATDPTGSGDPDFLITGDLNAYAKEDPIDAVEEGPDDTAGTDDDYTNLIAELVGPFAYSFVFDGMAGYLDHALSNTSLTPQVTGVTEWHVNADEPDLLDYDTSFKADEQEALYEPNAYRSSDHDPLLVGLDLETTFAGLCRATERAVSNAGIANSLCAKLRAAEAAEARRNAAAKAGALGAYANEVRAQTGKALTEEQAETLIRLASEL